MAIGRIPEPLAGVQESLFTTKGDLVVATGPSQVVRQGVGSNNQVLMADSVQADGVKWANEATATLTAKGDILTATGANTIARLGVGANGTTLVADSSEATGLKWATPAGGGKILQVVSAIADTNASVASTSYNDTGLSASITPSASSSKILVLITQGFGIFNSPDNGRFVMAMKIDRQIGAGSFSTVYRPVDTTNNYMEDIGTNTSQFRGLLSMSYLDSPSTTSSCTYKTVACTQQTANNQSVNFQLGGTAGQRGQSSIILMEVGA